MSFRCLTAPDETRIIRLLTNLVWRRKIPFMLTLEENDLLCQVEGAAPMGQIMRRHWIPAVLTEEVADPEGDPVPLRLLGEDLIAWRDTDHRVGLMDRYCPHRRASLQFGRNEDGGLRCLYHGWKMDVFGSVVEMPSEPPGACAAMAVKHKSYPTHEHAGIVWAYLGPDPAPAFEAPAFAPSPDTPVSIVKVQIECNWAQVLEGNIDSAHSSSLHSSEIRPARDVHRSSMLASGIVRPSTDMAPRIQVQQTDYGFRYAALRRPIRDADTHDYVRMTVFIAPFTVLIPPNSVYNVANMNVPIDDEHTMFYFLSWHDGTQADRGLSQEAWRKRAGAQLRADLDERFRKKRTLANNYGQDRQAMKNGSFTGIRGIVHQDIAMWETMGVKADRTRERLGASDLAIVEFRRRMVAAAREFQSVSTAIGTAGRSTPYASIRSFEGVAPKSTDWRELA